MNNIFGFATSELSQDAFLCWLINWSSPEFSEHPLHELGVAFVRRLVGDNSLKVEKCSICRQWKSIDILGVINERYVIVIEDKAGSCEHSDQLERYRERVEEKYPPSCGYVLCFWYIQTGNQCDFSQASINGYNVLSRVDLLDFFADNRKLVEAADNHILNDFVCYIQMIQHRVENYRNKPVGGPWNGSEWCGFYTDLLAAMRRLTKMDGAKWTYVPNPSGGFMCFSWNWNYSGSDGCGVYLQLEEGTLCVKIEVDAADASERRGLRKKYADLFCGCCVDAIKFSRPARFGNGMYMTVAVCSNYRIANQFNMVDVEKTAELLVSVMRFVDLTLSETD